MKTALLFRLGGLGDILILTSVARELKRRGYEVDGCFGSPTANPQKLIGNLGLFRTIFEYGRAPSGVDVYRIPDSNDLASIHMLKRGYDLPVDYKYSIELNSHPQYRYLTQKPGFEWVISQNSNFVHWVDMMFAWAGIDPYTIPDDDKIPVYKREQDEIDWAKKLVRFSNPKYVFAIQTNASSLVRTWYNPQHLVQALIEKYGQPNVLILVFDGSQWQMVKRGTVFPVVVPVGMDPIRASAAMVGEADVFIGADSGFSHLAEAMQKKSLTIYTTVPAWTRQRYYKYAKAIEPLGDTFDGIQCRPCFVLDRFCPRIREKALRQLSERELRLKKAIDTNENPTSVAAELQTTPNGVMMEANLTRQRYEALLEQQAPCSLTITTERILKELEPMV